MRIKKIIPEFTHFITIFFSIMWHIRSIVMIMSLWLTLCAIIIMFAEKISLGKAMYFSFVTGLTIGYGDVVMETPTGQVISIVIGLTGIIFTGLIVAAAVETIRKILRQAHRAD